MDIPDEHLRIAEWWELWKLGAYFGYGGARAPEEPRPVEAPSGHPTTDYREEIRARIIEVREAARLEPHESETPTAGLRYGTAVEEIPDGTSYILNLLTELMIAFQAFYTRFGQLGRQIPCSDPYLAALADRVVRLRMLIVAIRAQEHVNRQIDVYIVRYITQLLPEPPLP